MPFLYIDVDKTPPVIIHLDVDSRDFPAVLQQLFLGATIQSIAESLLLGLSRDAQEKLTMPQRGVLAEVLLFGIQNGSLPAELVEQIEKEASAVRSTQAASSKGKDTEIYGSARVLSLYLEYIKSHATSLHYKIISVYAELIGRKVVILQPIEPVAGSGEVLLLPISIRGATKKAGGDASSRAIAPPETSSETVYLLPHEGGCLILHALPSTPVACLSLASSIVPPMPVAAAASTVSLLSHPPQPFGEASSAALVRFTPSCHFASCLAGLQEATAASLVKSLCVQFEALFAKYSSYSSYGDFDLIARDFDQAMMRILQESVCSDFSVAEFLTKIGDEANLRRQAAECGFDEAHFQEVASDGSCFYHAVLDQIDTDSNIAQSLSITSVLALRRLVGAGFVANLKLLQDYVLQPFGHSVGHSAQQYLSGIYGHAWAGNPEILLTSFLLGINIVIINSDGSAPVVFRSSTAAGAKTICLGYDVVAHHYWSLRKEDGKLPSQIQGLLEEPSLCVVTEVDKLGLQRPPEESSALSYTLLPEIEEMMVSCPHAKLQQKPIPLSSHNPLGFVPCSQFKDNVAKIRSIKEIQARLMSKASSVEKAKALIELHKNLMDIPHKFGRENLHKTVKGEKWSGAEYLIKLGLPSLVTEILQVIGHADAEEVLAKLFTEQYPGLVEEIAKTLDVVADNFLHFQMQEAVLVAQDSALPPVECVGYDLESVRMREVGFRVRSMRAFQQDSAEIGRLKHEMAGLQKDEGRLRAEQSVLEEMLRLYKEEEVQQEQKEQPAPAPAPASAPAQARSRAKPKRTSVVSAEEERKRQEMARSERMRSRQFLNRLLSKAEELKARIGQLDALINMYAKRIPQPSAAAAAESSELQYLRTCKNLLEAERAKLEIVEGCITRGKMSALSSEGLVAYLQQISSSIESIAPRMNELEQLLSVKTPQALREEMEKVSLEAQKQQEEIAQKIAGYEKELRDLGAPTPTQPQPQAASSKADVSQQQRQKRREGLQRQIRDQESKNARLEDETRNKLEVLQQELKKAEEMERLLREDHEALPNAGREFAELKREFDSIHDFASDVGGVEYPLLQRYQRDYDRKNVDRILAEHYAKLQSAGSNVEIMLAIENFIGWIKEQCGKEMRDKIESLLPPGFAKILQMLRNRIKHCLDDMQSFRLVASMGGKSQLELAKRGLLEIIKLLQSPEIIGYLQTDAADAVALPGSIAFAHEPEFVRACSYLPELPGVGKKLSVGEQLILFASSIKNSSRMIKTLISEWKRDTAGEGSAARIVGLFDRADSELDPAELHLKCKYDGLIQAIGEALGNLQQFDVLTMFAGMKLDPEQFGSMGTLVSMVKDYRSSSSHCGYHNVEMFRTILDLLTNDSLPLKLDMLYKTVLERSRSLLSAPPVLSASCPATTDSGVVDISCLMQ